MIVNNEAVDEAARGSASRPIRESALRRRLRKITARWRAILLLIIVFGATGFCTDYFYFTYRNDAQTDRAAASQAIQVASDGAVALLSYSPDTLARDFGNAKSRVTEDYLSYYQQFAERVVGPAALRGQVSSSASVVKAAVSQLRPNSAVVLIILRQKTTSKQKPDPVVTSSSVQVTLAKVNGSWLIAKCDAL